MLTTDISTQVSLAEYLEKEFSAKTKSEYIQSEIVAMPYTSENHGQIVSNLSVKIGMGLQKKNYRFYIADRMLYVAKNTLGLDEGNIYYPDLMIVPEPPMHKQMSANMTATLNPVVLIEVLSDSNAETDLLTKLADYKTIDTLQQYLIFRQTSKQIESFVRNGNQETWLNQTITEQHETTKILDFEIAIQEIYDKVVFSAS
jgi:Uma2 family endonuclease